MSNLRYHLAKRKFGPKHRLSIYQKLSAFLSNGVDIDNAMKQMSDGYRHYNKKDFRSVIIDEWRESMAVGTSFSNALAMWAPAGEVMLIKSGERSGDLPGAMVNACVATDAGNRMKSTIIASTSYPGVLLALLFVMLYMFAVSAIPPLVESKDPATWPTVSKGLYYMSYFVQHYWMVSIAFVGIAAMIVGSTLSRWVGKARDFIEILPPYSIYKSYQGSVFLVSLAAMMKTGVPVWNALDELKELSSPYMKRHIEMMQNRLLNGVAIGAALETGLLDRDIAIDLRVYSSTSNIEEKMGVIGASAIEAGVRRISLIGTILNGVALAMIGGYIGWTLIGFTMLTNAISADQMMMQ